MGHPQVVHLGGPFIDGESLLEEGFGLLELAAVQGPLGPTEALRERARVGGRGRARGNRPESVSRMSLDDLGNHLAQGVGNFSISPGGGLTEMAVPGQLSREFQG